MMMATQSDLAKPVLSLQEIQDAETRGGGWALVHRTLLTMLTRDVVQVAQAAAEDEDFRAQLKATAEDTDRYFAWLEAVREVLRCGQSRLFWALSVCDEQLEPGRVRKRA